MGSKISIHKYDNLRVLSKFAALDFSKILTGNKISIVIPGGTTPRLFLKYLSSFDIDWSMICLVLSDERMVPIKDPDSNFGMIKNILLDKISSNNKPKIIPEMDKLDFKKSSLFLEDTNKLLSSYLPINRAYLGIGSDGHTASLFSNKKMSSNTSYPYFYIKNDTDPYSRISLSLEFLKKIPEICFLVSGESKKPIVKTMIDGNNDGNNYPVFKLISQSVGRFTIFCDSDAWCEDSNY